MTHRFRNLHPSPAIAQRDRNGPLGRLLADDVFVEFAHDFLRSHVLRQHGLRRCLLRNTGRLGCQAVSC